MITTDTTNNCGTTVAKDYRTVMQGKVAIAGEASYHGPLCLSGDERIYPRADSEVSFV